MFDQHYLELFTDVVHCKGVAGGSLPRTNAQERISMALMRLREMFPSISGMI